MNNVYDILLNFNKRYIEYFDWNNSDKKIHIKKTIIFFIDNKTYFDIKNNNIIVDNNFLNKIYNKINKKFLCLFTNGIEVIAVNFDKKGKNIYKSSLLLNESEEILKSVPQMNKYKLNYKLISINNIDFFKTRRELEIKKYIYNCLVSEKNINKIKYIYFECFNTKEDDYKKALFRIKNELLINWNFIYKKLFYFFKITTNKNNKKFIDKIF